MRLGRGELRLRLRGARRLSPTSRPAPLFTDVTVEAGIDARHSLPPAGITDIVDSNGGGAAFVDLDDDGWLDLLVAGGTRSPDPDADSARHGGLRAYRNQRDGSFEDVTEAWGLPPEGTGIAWSAADFYGDGDRDLYLVDREPNRLFENLGGGELRDITARGGVGDAGFGISVAFFDMEGDGDLDLYCANYLEFDENPPSQYRAGAHPGPLAWPAQADLLYRNRGDGTFEDVSGPSGIAAVAGRAMSVTAADLDEDRDQDLYVLNDATPSYVFLNDGYGRFVESGARCGLALGRGGRPVAAMAIGIGDLDADGHLDVTVSDDVAGSVFTRVAPGVYEDRAGRSGLPELMQNCVSWGHNLFDADRDGDLDIFTVNGGLTTPIPQVDV
ncbi:MAG: RNA-binding protein, partial [Gemmatimonadetes bacterium]|nr:RNA-binding protein [Gemmatimonadota bacterium]